MSVESILLYTIFAGILSIVYGYFTGKNILNLSAGNSKMQIKHMLKSIYMMFCLFYKIKFIYKNDL